MKKKQTILWDLGLEVELTLPEKPIGLVIFSQDSETARSMRSCGLIARQLRAANFGTLMYNLVNGNSKQVKDYYKTELSTSNLIAITKWAGNEPGARDLNIGYLGISAGADAALRAGAIVRNEIKSLTVMDGRKLPVGKGLSTIDVPVLLIIGGLDSEGIALNQKVMKEINGVAELYIIPGVTYVFENHKNLPGVIAAAIEWFNNYLKTGSGKAEKTRITKRGGTRN